MKVFNSKIVIYDQTAQEKKKSVATLKRESFVDDNWDYEDALEGTYTGARISYKSGKNSKEISVFLGLKAEKASGNHTIRRNLAESEDMRRSVRDDLWHGKSKRKILRR